MKALQKENNLAFKGNNIGSGGDGKANLCSTSWRPGDLSLELPGKSSPLFGLASGVPQETNL